MSYVVVSFIAKWMEEGRFPREELKARWWILFAGGIVIGGLAVAVLITVI